MKIRRIIEIEEKDYESACKVTMSLDGAMSIYQAIRESKPYDERQQAEWKRITSKSADIQMFLCSKCGRKVEVGYSHISPSVYYPFCHCGADMRGGEDHE